MFDSFPPLLKAYDTAAKTLSAFLGWQRKTKGDTQALIEELKENSRLFWLVIKEETTIDRIISGISFVEYDRLNRAGFNFNNLQRRKIAKSKSLKNSRLSTWEGAKTEKLVKNIYDKIKDIKTMYPHTMNSTNFRWKVRVRNAQERILLLLKHAAK